LISKEAMKVPGWEPLKDPFGVVFSGEIFCYKLLRKYSNPESFSVFCTYD